MKKVLILASVASMIDQFNMPIINLLLQKGFCVEVACNFEKGNSCTADKIDKLEKKLVELGVKYYHINFDRNVLNLVNLLKAYKEVYSLMSRESYEFVHCHSPIGGIVGRLVGKKTGTKVIYTAHGFHFYKGAPLINKILYYNIEKMLSKSTDALITINTEDYRLAMKKFKAKQVFYVHGVGVNTEKFDVSTASNIRKELNIADEKTVIFSIGELNKNKNHKTVIKAIKNLDVVYLIAGQGKKKKQLEKLINKNNLKDKVFLLGFRNDIKNILYSSDLFVFPSFREGLSVSLMEAMSMGKPCIVSKIRGNVDLIDENGGLLFNPKSTNECMKSIKCVMSDKKNMIVMGNYNKNKVQEFSLDVVLKEMNKIYDSII